MNSFHKEQQADRATAHNSVTDGEGAQEAKKAPDDSGAVAYAYSPHLADKSAGIGTIPARNAGGLPGFIGPLPSTSLDESGGILTRTPCLWLFEYNSH